MTAICVFPECGHPAYDQNRAGQPACAGHVRVVVGSSDDLGKGGRHSEGVHQ
jgi:hypothetical protein